MSSVSMVAAIAKKCVVAFILLVLLLTYSFTPRFTTFQDITSYVYSPINPNPM